MSTNAVPVESPPDPVDEVAVPRTVTDEGDGTLISRAVPDAASDVATPNAASGGPAGPRRKIHTYPTVRLDPRDLKPSWPIAIACLEQLAPWPVLALRLGTLALIQTCVRELAEPNARADLVVKLRDLVEALAHMPLEG